MESGWQKEFIRENLPKLITTTMCTEEVLAVLFSEGIIGEFEVEEIGSLNNRFKKSEMTYTIIRTRKNGYEIITEALDDCGQTEARDLLLTGYLVNGNPLPSKFANSFKTWADLDQKGKEAILSKRISLYGEIYSLEEIGNLITRERLYDICCKHVCGGVLRTLLERKDVTLSIREQTVLETPRNYISRTISFRSNLNLGILNYVCGDLIIIKNIKWHDLCNITSENRISTSSMYIRDNLNSLLLDSSRNLHVECVLLENDDHLGKLCRLSKQPVHLLCYHRTHFEWLWSSGNMEIIHKCISKQQEEISEELFVSNILTCTGNAPVLIADAPGMGKSFLLINMAHQSRKRQTNKLVIFMVITDLIQSFKVTKEKPDIGIIMKHIARKCCTEALFLDFVEQILVSLFMLLDVELYLDGFDELLVNQNPIMSQILQIIQRDWRKCQMFVTTRQHLMLDLENTLHVLGHTILPFNRSNQIEFLISYWTIEAKIPNNVELQKFAEECLNFLETSATESDIAGVPLQCSILAEIYCDKAKEYASGDASKYAAESFVHAKSVFDMFAKLIELRLGRLDMEQNYIDESVSMLQRFWDYLVSAATLKDKVKDIHVFAALKILLPEQSQKFHEQLLSERSKYLPYAQCVGLLEKLPEDHTSEPRFFHRTFAEYLIADFIVDVMIRNKKTYWSESQRLEFTGFFIRKVLQTSKTTNTSIPQISDCDFKFVEAYEFSNYVICYFLNYILRNIEHVDFKFFTGLCEGVQYDVNDWYRLLMACIYHGYVHIFRLLSKQFIQHQKRFANADTQIEMGSVLMCLASGFADIILFDEVSYICRLLHSKETVQKQHLSICSAAASGNIDIFCVLSKSVEFGKVPLLLHYCVTNSFDNSSDIIKNKIKIIDIVAEKHPQSINEVQSGRTPLLVPNVATDLLKALIQNGANTLVQCFKFGNSFMHNVMVYLPNEELQELIQFLFLVGKFKVFGLVNNQQRTPLEEMLIQKQTSAPLSVAKLILSHEPTISSLYDYCVCNSFNDPIDQIRHKANIIGLVAMYNATSINETDKKLNTVPLLMDNIAPDILKALVTNGANTLIRCNDSNNTFVHRVAGYLSVEDLCILVEFLYKSGKFEVFGTVNNELRTPLEEMLVQKRHLLPEHICRFILERERTISSLYGYCVSNSVHDPHYLYTHKQRIISLASEIIPNSINEADKSLNTVPLLMNNIHLEIIKTLVNKGANISTKCCKSGDTFLQKAAQYLTAEEIYELVEYLSFKGKYTV